jgi:hypothetical protein
MLGLARGAASFESGRAPVVPLKLCVFGESGGVRDARRRFVFVQRKSAAMIQDATEVS